MVNNKGLRFLLNIVVYAVIILIVNFVDNAFSTNGNCMLGTLFSGILWIIYLVYYDLLEDANRWFTILIRDIVLVLWLGASIAVLAIGILGSMSMVDKGVAFGGVIMFAPVLTHILTMYFCGTEKEWVKMPFVPAIIMVASIAVGALLWIFGDLVFIPAILFGVACVVSTVRAFKGGAIEFLPLYERQYNYSSSYDDDDDDDSCATPKAAMEAIAKRYRGGILTKDSDFLLEVRCSYGYQSVQFNISGEVFVKNKYDPDMREIERAINSELKYQISWIERDYNSAIERLVKAGVDCSSIQNASVRTTSIRYV